jgi:hypothetical protein
VLFHVELSRVKTPGVSESGKLASRKDLLQEFTCRETTIHDQPSVFIHGDQSGRDAQQLGNFRTNADTRGSNAEELIDESTSNHENGTDDPGTERAGRQIWVIVVVNHSTDFGVGRVLHLSHQRPTHAVRISLRLTTMIRAASILSSS